MLVVDDVKLGECHAQDTYTTLNLTVKVTVLYCEHASNACNSVCRCFHLALPFKNVTIHSLTEANYLDANVSHNSSLRSELPIGRTSATE